MKTDKAGFIGLGAMGAPMAGHLYKAGHLVSVFNRSPAKLADFVTQYAVHRAATPAEVADRAAIVFTCVSADADLLESAVHCPQHLLDRALAAGAPTGAVERGRTGTL